MISRGDTDGSIFALSTSAKESVGEDNRWGLHVLANESGVRRMVSDSVLKGTP
jgi:hypothetical protein